MITLSPDDDLQNADWTKQSWDLHNVTNLKQLKAFLRTQGMTPEHFKTLPVYKNNVGKLPWLKKL